MNALCGKIIKNAMLCTTRSHDFRGNALSDVLRRMSFLTQSVGMRKYEMVKSPSNKISEISKISEIWQFLLKTHRCGAIKP